MSPAFVPALQLSGQFYRDVVRPLLREQPHSAALIGWGSDVLGYDTERSTDHGWGPRLQLFVADTGRVGEVAALIDANLPDSYAGWSVRFGWDREPTRHWVTVTTTGDWLRDQLGIDAVAGPTTTDWLVTPQQRLLELTAGRVYSDEAGELTEVRERLSWYPDQVWRWLIACQWHRLAQEEAFVGRTAELGDVLGFEVVVARLCRDVMRLAFLLARRYAPYQKWLGTAFAELPCDDDLPAQLAKALGRGGDLDARQQALGAAYSTIADRHNASGLTAPLSTGTRDYHSRPGEVLMADRFAQACRDTVTDPLLARLPLIGAVDQHTDNTDVLSETRLFRSMIALYE